MESEVGGDGRTSVGHCLQLDRYALKRNDSEIASRSLISFCCHRNGGRYGAEMLTRLFRDWSGLKWNRASIPHSSFSGLMLVRALSFLHKAD